VNEELDAMLKSLENRLKEQRLTTRQYFMYNCITEDEYRESNRDRARERVIRTQALQEFARREGISVEDDEIHAEMDKMLEPFQGEERTAAEKVLGTNEAHHDVEDRIFQRKIVERLTGIAEGRIEAAKPEEVEGKSEVAGGAEDLVAAGGAAEVLGTWAADTTSELSTGKAEGGGTPEEAPAAEEGAKS
jgi:FKBP-type peptidyl-prolyl cis-trans isomerase (trigger factor)